MSKYPTYGEDTMEPVILLHTFKRIQPHCLVIPEYSKKTQIYLEKLVMNGLKGNPSSINVKNFIMIHVWFLRES